MIILYSHLGAMQREVTLISQLMGRNQGWLYEFN